MNDIRLIVMDMDGTLLNSSQQVSAGNAQALREAQAQGVHLAICSGRAPADIALFAQEQGLEPCSPLALNGTCICLSGGQKVIANHCFSQKALENTIVIFNQAGCVFNCFSQNDLVIFNDDEGRYDRDWISHSGDRLTLLRGMPGLERVREKGINKIIAILETPEQADETRAKLAELNDIEVTSSWINNLELMPLGCNKGTAVAELAAYYGLSKDQVMALGDFDNDLPMIQWAGWGVAMGNANKKVKQAARVITRTNDEDGVAWAVEQYVLH